MKCSKYRSSFIGIIPILILLYPALMLPEDSPKGVLEIDTAGQIAVRSNTFEIDNKRNIMTFSGDVDARRDDLTMNCQKMLLYFRNNPGDKDSGKGKISVDKIVATGDVKVIRTDGGLAIAEKAVYYQDDEKAVLAGNPVVKQGDDFIEGSVITLFLKENRSVVEGSKVKKAKVILFLKNGKK